MVGRIEITVGDVNDVEARVYARFVGADEVADDAAREKIKLSGTLRGPYCEGTRTLPAHIEFRAGCATDVTAAEAVVPDPCTWTRDLPHLYQADLEAWQGDRLLAEYHGTIGLRRGAGGNEDVSRRGAETQSEE
jgi:hypothetical protein